MDLALCIPFCLFEEALLGEHSIQETPQMPTKRSIRAKEIVSDIRAGMTNHQLMEKYQVSLDKLQNIFKQLLDARAVERSELGPLISVPHSRIDVRKRRKLHWHYVFVKLPIYDLENLLDKGTVIDISETGLQISGLPTEVGDTKEFLIQVDYFADVFPFILEAKCTWSSKAEEGPLFSCFQITSITEGALEELRKLTSMLTLSE